MIRIWECELKKAVFDETIARVEAEIIHNGEILTAAQNARRTTREEYRKERRLQKEREMSIKTELREQFDRR